MNKIFYIDHTSADWMKPIHVVSELISIIIPTFFHIHADWLKPIHVVNAQILLHVVY